MTESGIKFIEVTDATVAPWVGVIASDPGLGKTTLALTGTEGYRCYVADTELRVSEVIRTSFMDVKDRIFPYHIHSWRQMEYFKDEVKKLRPGIVIIDSGTDLRGLAEKAYLDAQEGNRKKLAVPEWGAIDYMFKQIMDPLRNAGFHILFTTELREKHIGAKGTGKFEPRIREYVLRRADFVLEHTKDEDDEERKWLCTKCAWHPYETWGSMTFPVLKSSLKSILGTLRTKQPEAL